MSSYELTQAAGSITFNSSKTLNASRSLCTQHVVAPQPCWGRTDCLGSWGWEKVIDICYSISIPMRSIMLCSATDSCIFGKPKPIPFDLILCQIINPFSYFLLGQWSLQIPKKLYVLFLADWKDTRWSHFWFITLTGALISGCFSTGIFLNWIWLITFEVMSYLLLVVKTHHLCRSMNCQSWLTSFSSIRWCHPALYGRNLIELAKDI